MLSRSVSGYEIEGWKGVVGKRREREREREDGANEPLDFYFYPFPLGKRALRAAPKWLPAWLNVVKNGRALPPNLTGIFLYKKRRERKVMNPIFQHRIIRSFPRGWIRGCDSPRFIIRLGIYSWLREGRHFFSSISSSTYLHRSGLVRYLLNELFKYRTETYLWSKRFLRRSLSDPCEIFSFTARILTATRHSWINAVLILRSRMGRVS